jgi:hypothetical protein
VDIEKLGAHGDAVSEERATTHSHELRSIRDRAIRADQHRARAGLYCHAGKIELTAPC